MPSSQPVVKILVFDSGVGGLSIFDAVKHRLSHCDLFFLCDNAGYPYGSKTEDYLASRVPQVIGNIVPIIKPDIIVVACNTASTVTLPLLRETFTIPIVGVVPAVKPAAKLSSTNIIGLLATPGTIARDYTRQLIIDFATGCKIITIGSAELVDIAESKLRGDTVSCQQIKHIIKPFTLACEQNPPLDTVILACTHFPLLYPELKAALPSNIKWVDSGDAISRRVEQLIKLNIPMKNQPQHDKLESSLSGGLDNCQQLTTTMPDNITTPMAFFTEKNAHSEQLKTALTAYDIKHIEYIDVAPT